MRHTFSMPRMFIGLLAITITAVLTAVLQGQTAPADPATASAPATASRPATARGGRGATPARTGVLAADHNPALPTLFIIGDSTVKNSWDRGTDGLWGWGRPLAAYFDITKINVDNQALGGTSSHSYQTANWPGVLKLIQKGDFLILQFGTNDNGAASLKGNGDETQPATGRGAGGDLHSFGWYVRQYIKDTREKGATPIVASLVPRRSWATGGVKMNRADDTHGGWAKAAAAQEHADFIDLNNLIADRYDTYGPKTVESLFGPTTSGGIETVHTNWWGAIVAAECVVDGIKKLPDNPLNKYLLPTPAPARLIRPDTDKTPAPAGLPEPLKAMTTPPK